MTIDTATLRPSIVTRAEATQRKLVWYYTGRPCGRGHLAMRYTTTGNCCGCKARLRQPGDTGDGRRVPRVVRMRYVKSSTAAQRRAWGEYLRVCLDAFEAQHGPTAVIDKV